METNIVTSSMKQLGSGIGLGSSHTVNDNMVTTHGLIRRVSDTFVNIVKTSQTYSDIMVTTQGLIRRVSDSFAVMFRRKAFLHW